MEEMNDTVFTTALLVTAEERQQPKIQQLVNLQRQCSPFPQGNTRSPKKIMKSCHLQNVDGLEIFMLSEVSQVQKDK